ncbi:receptor-type adenylate cyclase GRESAG 4,putative [Trypanosoma brucei gambiense DAL972]|uniref:adenylate cyclase n=1 Tax=Trypanosoma brucei gambiense (strain MHOM/CI/86/DAL972) TaxID=679716 RepID=C9ZQ51_TRYB9|nr:receptor-type adenylate cyclase GRESAG 4,putative [Trypanosoma brucei gambiense DAL972]CBH11531.1 receptor-type adenylate cyclase GRESAG 4,putative [Trypanosoma brucei gambiense DAL972]|eukprot:XP_011773816.1 receptor-type adenylate cyclase GRESAG 4,putative [Trypanosoma brucei gambiense DAL972]
MSWQEGGGRGCVYPHGNCRRNLTARSPARRYSMYKHSPVITAMSLLHLLPLLLMWMPPVCAENGNVTVNVLSMMYSLGFTTPEVNAINAGFDASLSAHSWKTGSGATISVIRPSSPNATIEDIFQLGVKQSEGKLLVVFGPLGTNHVLKNSDELKKHDLVAIAPVAYSSEVRGWNPHLYFISVEPNAELLTLIRYAVVYLRVPRIGMMYEKDNTASMGAYEFTVRVLAMLGRHLCGVFVVKDSENQNISEDDLNTRWRQFVATRPQAILLFSSLGNTAKWFIKKVAQDNRTANAYLLSTSLQQHFLIKMWREALVLANRTFTPGQLITTGTVPLANDNQSSLIQHFQRDMNNYLDTNSDWKGFAKPDHYLEDDGLGEMMVYGWLAGEVLFEALNNAPQLTNRTSFRESLYKQRRYVIDDLVVGDFGGECNEAVALQGAMCECNQGGSMVYMKSIMDGFRLRPLWEGFLTWGVSECSSANVQVSAPLSGLFVILVDNAIVFRATMRWFLGAQALDEAYDVDNRIFFHPLTVSSENVTQSLEQVRDNRDVSAVFGIVPAAMLDTPNMMFISPMVVGIRQNGFRRNVIHLLPVLAQQLYVLAVYLSNTSSRGVNAFIRGEQAGEISSLLYKSLVTFGVPLDSSKTLGDGDPISSYLSGNRDVFTIGLTLTDVAAVARHLQTHRRARVFVGFNDLAMYYDEFVAAFNASKESIASSERLLFATSFPHWAEKDTKSDVVASFHRIVNESHWDPLTFIGFVAARLLQVILPNMKKVNAELLADRIYTESNIKVDDMRFGPFSDVECVSGTSVSANECASNFGSTNISVWSMARVLNSSLPRTQVGMTPSMDYVIPQEGQLTRSQIAGIAIGCVVGFILFIALGVLLRISLRNARDNNLAPKEPTDPVTLIFTDIESSTALWAAHPELMPDAVAAHHRMVRSLIGRYDCYEVKTVGDSFMIASKSPFAAVQLAQELQLCFLQHDWGTNAVDNSYRHFEEQFTEGECEYTPPTARLDPEVYSRLWNGLRVRVGIHTGLCDIRHDEVTKGYDYYGRTPNMAARTESVANGGQVLMTGSTYMSLSAEDRKQIDVTALGDVALRGVSDPVKMYQLNAVPGRNFAALRLDREYFFDEGEDGTTTSTSDHSSSRAELSESAQIIATALQSLLSTFKTAQREKLLLPYCERWRVPLPRKAASEWDDAYCEEVVRRIAVKVGRVADHCAHSGSESSSTQGSSSIIIVPLHDLYCRENYSI